MATDNLNHAPQDIDFGGGQRRVDLCLDATYQIDAMSDALLKAAYANNSVDAASLPYLVQGIVARVRELNLTIMAALDGSGEDESSLLSRMANFEKAGAA